MRQFVPFDPAALLVRHYPQTDGLRVAASGGELRRHRVIIVTTRTESHEEPEWWRVHEPDRVTNAAFLSGYRLPVGRVFFTEHQPKADTLLRHGIELHYDDDPQEVAAAQAAGVQSVLLNGVSFHV